jgi:hypothetical protein
LDPTEKLKKAAWVPLDEYREMINAKDSHPMMQHVMELNDQDNDIQQTVVASCGVESQILFLPSETTVPAEKYI